MEPLGASPSPEPVAYNNITPSRYKLEPINCYRDHDTNVCIRSDIIVLSTSTSTCYYMLECLSLYLVFFRISVLMVLILVTAGLILGRVRLGGREREGGEREWRKKNKWNKRKILEEG